LGLDESADSAGFRTAVWLAGLSGTTVEADFASLRCGRSRGTVRIAANNSAPTTSGRRKRDLDPDCL
jgi:hypothetical protein